MDPRPARVCLHHHSTTVEDMCSYGLKTEIKVYFYTYQGILKGVSGLFLTPVLMLRGSGHIGCHAWRWVIVPSDLAYHSAQSAHIIVTVWFTARYPTCVSDFSPCGKGNSRQMKLLGGLSYEKIRRHNNSPSYVTARWPPQQIPP